MKKTIIAIASATIVLLMPVAASAQFGGLFGGKASSANSGSDLSTQQNQLVRSYVGAGKDISTANGQMADALGLKAQAVNASATSDSMSAKDVEDQDKAISTQAAAVSDAIKSGATLKDSDAKAEYAKGLVTLVSGVKKYADMRKDTQTFASSLSGASLLQLPKLQAGAYIVKNLPIGISNLASVLKSAIDFAKTNGVDVPKDATSVL